MADKLLILLTAAIVMSILEAVIAVMLNLKRLPLKDRMIRGLFNFIYGYFFALVWWLG